MSIRPVKDVPSEVLSETARIYLRMDFLDRFVSGENVKEFFEILHTNSSELKIFGYPDDFIAELISFRDFPSNYLIFSSAITEPCYSSPRLYRSIKNKEFIIKSDILVDLENRLFEWNKSEINLRFVSQIAIMALRKFEKELDKNLEFVNCSLDDLNQFTSLDDLSETYKNIQDGKNLRNTQFTKREHEDFLEEMRSYADTEEDRNHLRSLIQIELKASEIEVHKKIAMILGTIRILRNKIFSRPEWFTPDSELEESMRSPAIVRLFEDNNHQFIMIPELISVMKKAGIEIDPLMNGYEGCSDVIPTITFREAFNMIKREDLQKIEFVKTAIRRTKHTAIPIPTHNGSHCVLSVDALFDILYSLIRKQKIFQQSEHIDWPVIENLVNQVTSFFNGDGEDPCITMDDGTQLFSWNVYTPIENGALRYNGKNRKNSKTEKSIGMRNFREPLTYLCYTLEEFNKFTISFEKEFGEEASDDRVHDYISKQKEKKIFIRVLLFTLMDPIKNRRVLMEEVIYSLPCILKQQSIYTKENIEKLESLKEKYIKNRSDHLFVTIDLEELRMVLDNFNIDKKEITLVPDFMSFRFVHEPMFWKLYQNRVYINSSFGQLVSSNDICFFLFEKFVCSYDWSPIFHCGHETPFKSCLCGLRDKLIQTFLELMETENFYRPFSHYEIYSKQITQCIDHNSIKLSCSPFYDLIGYEYNDMMSMQILLEDEYLGAKSDRFHSDKQREEARKLQIQLWQMKTVLMISAGTVFFKREYPNIYDTILKGIAFKIPFMYFYTQEEMELSYRLCSYYNLY
uniref:HD domain-containing protein n=1 Tax=Caenorhabditis tropicalis TaxID=1561998 RepID=A0A1I7TYR0_9PELO